MVGQEMDSDDNNIICTTSSIYMYALVALQLVPVPYLLVTSRPLHVHGGVEALPTLVISKLTCKLIKKKKNVDV